VCSGTEIWSKGFGGIVDEQANAVAIDALSNILVGGYFSSPMDVGCGVIPTPMGVNDVPFLIKLGPQGNCVWSKGFSIANPGTTDQIKGVAVDSSNNVYVVGGFYGGLDLGGGMFTSAGQSDVFVAKFNAAGALQWSKRYGDATTQFGKAIGVDAAGHVYFAGSMQGTVDFGGGPLVSAGGFDTFVASLDTAGNFLWAKRAGDAADQQALSVAVDAGANVLVTGIMAGSINFGGGALTSLGQNDVFALKLSSAGAHLWSKRFGDTGDDWGNGVGTDPAGDVLLTGFFSGPKINFGGADIANAGGVDAYVVKLDPSGALVWGKGAGDAKSQSGFTITGDSAGDVVVSGYLSGTANFGGGVISANSAADPADIFLVKYTGAGAYLWGKAFGEPSFDFTRGLATDAMNDIVAVGLINGAVDFGGGLVNAPGGEDFFVAKFAP
jgi:Beta-propeller repeat